MVSVPPAAPDAERLPAYRPQSRIAMRAMTEFAGGMALDLTLAFDGFLEVGLAFVMLMRATSATERFGPDTAREPPGTISINALAALMDRPFETVRRYAHRMIDHGWASPGRDGLAVDDRVFLPGDRLVLLEGIHDRLVQQIASLAALDYAMPEPDAPHGPTRAVVLDAAMELMLKGIEIGSGLYGGVIPLLILSSLMTANARPISASAELSQTYSGSLTPPPDALRQPITPSALSRALAVPYPTVRRYVQRMMREGRVVSSGPGLLVSIDWLQNPAALATGTAITRRLNEMLVRLARAGFPLGDAASAYLGTPPKPLDFS